MENKKNLHLIIDGILNSYSQVFFSDRKLFGFILMAITFLNPAAGLAGLLGIMVSVILGLWLGYDKYTLSKGLYSFNTLLVSLGLGLFFKPGIVLYFIIVLAGILTFFINISLKGILAKYQLPSLSIPFLISIWIFVLATRQFHSVDISESEIFRLNDIYWLGGSGLVNVYEWFNDLSIWFPVKAYFLSLGSIFFQYNILAGILIAFGLLYFSRIAFSLSVLGFAAALSFYHLVGADIHQLNYMYIGFNYILTAIAIGGYFLVPSRMSYLWIIILTPLVAVLTVALSSIFNTWQLSIYSLPFNLIVIVFLYILKLRIRKGENLQEVYYQQYSPEKNLYAYTINKDRMKSLYYFPIKLPFWGDWTIQQGHFGEHTHKGDWGHAWDFVIENQDKKTYQKDGYKLEDYYCYNKTVLAPANGIIVEIEEGIPDNPVGDMNLSHNWGNTVVIKHLDKLYTKISHLKTGSLQVKKGDYVLAGQLIGNVGNSGRSPEPHIHFQIQSSAYIESPTLDYPISYYLLKNQHTLRLKSYSIPEKDDIIAPIEINQLIKKAFHLVPGQKFNILLRENGHEKLYEWEVKSNILNQTYIHCKTSDSYAYLYNDETVHYFTSFYGEKDGPLFLFYLAAYKILLSYYQNLEIEDAIPINLMFPASDLFFQDFAAPFQQYLSSSYSLKYLGVDDELSPSEIKLGSRIESKIGKRLISTCSFKFKITEKGISHINIEKGKKKLEIIWPD